MNKVKFFDVFFSRKKLILNILISDAEFFDVFDINSSGLSDENGLELNSLIEVAYPITITHLPQKEVGRLEYRSKNTWCSKV